MLKRISLVVSLAVALFAAQDPFLKIGDLESFFVRKLGLSYEEANLKADQLYSKGMELFNAPSKPLSSTLMGKKFTYKSATKKKEAVRYLIASGLLGNKDAALIAIRYLTIDSFLPGSLRYRAILAKRLHDQGYLYGTYLLAWAYLNGRGVPKNVDLAKLYFGQVQTACQKSRDSARKRLVGKPRLDQRELRAADRRCTLATMLYTQLRKGTPFAPYKGRVDASFKEKVRKVLRQKGDEAIRNAYTR